MLTGFEAGMRIHSVSLWIASVILCSAVSAQTPPSSLDGKAYAFSPSAPYQVSVPLQLEFGSGTFDEGFSDSLLADDLSYTYADGVITFYGGEEKVDLTYTSPTEGTYVLSEQEWDEGLTDYVWVEDEAGTFSEVSASLAFETNWQHSATMDSAPADTYWSVWQRSADSLLYSGGELSFIFADGGSVENGEYTEFELAYGHTLPMDADWQVVLDDLYVANAVGDFYVELDLEVPGTDFECELGFYKDSVYSQERSAYVYVGNDSDGLYASVTAVQVPDIANSLSLRIAHEASCRELVFEYQPDGATEWTELARLDLANGDFTNTAGTSSAAGNGELVSTSQRMVLDVQVETFQATSAGDLSIGGIEIGSYTPPIDSDCDGLDDSVETNTGVYLSASDTGTDPNLSDSSGDGFTDGEAVAAGVDPNVDYSNLLAIVRENPERFDLATLDMQMHGVRLERDQAGSFSLNFDLEMSTDLETWTLHSTESVPLNVSDESQAFIRLQVE